MSTIDDTLASSIPVQSLPYISGNTRSWNTHGTTKKKSRRRTATAPSKSLDVSPTVESEYIKNLQQQVYFLELECEYLREQNHKAVTVPKQLTVEAERMVGRLHTMKSKLKDREADLAQQESTIHLLQHDKESSLSKLKNIEEMFSFEKKELVNEIVELKKLVEKIEYELRSKEAETQKLQTQLEDSLSETRESHNNANILKAELTEKIDECNKYRISYEETRNTCLKSQTEYKELEERLYRTKVQSRDELEKGLQDEIKQLRYELRQACLQSEQDKTLRLKISDDCGSLVKENAALSALNIDLKKKLDAEQHFSHDSSLRKQANIQELVTVKEEKRHGEREIERLKELLELEQHKYRSLLDKYTEEEESFTRVKLNRSKLKQDLEELRTLESSESMQNVKLRRDKQLLQDQVSKLERKLQTSEDQLRNSHSKWQDLQASNADLSAKLHHQTNFDRIRWHEFERMADEMKEFSRSISPVRQSINASMRSMKLDVDE